MLKKKVFMVRSSVGTKLPSSTNRTSSVRRRLVGEVRNLFSSQQDKIPQIVLLTPEGMILHIDEAPAWRPMRRSGETYGRMKAWRASQFLSPWSAVEATRRDRRNRRQRRDGWQVKEREQLVESNVEDQAQRHRSKTRQRCHGSRDCSRGRRHHHENREG
ncbi:hypothetical protein FALBO_13393 [Fusarium albosuccineum]|uniref:Uncharacterized protein n=1 Tax=Fusarium albosuccineum TaxID=1237068 RepID=A0A8H4L1C1_9HYPO|nr:hypothetical protein FALBO_13393 [Fusarium albosuccineum]